MAPSSPRPETHRTVTTRPFSAHTRRAALDLLSHARFDVLIIGGGITGAGVARDAAMRGLRTALVERDDFASGTSSRSSRLIHGGLRYLEHGWLHLVFESSRERRTLMRIAPHLVRPLAFTWPVYDEARVPLWKLGAGLMVYDALALFRNLGGNHRRLVPDEVVELEPAIRRDGLRGGARYFDASTNDVRLTLANVKAAVDEGATVMNHAEVRMLRRAGSHVTGAHVVDRITGKGVDVTARAVVNATGPWSDSIRRMVDPHASTALRGTKGVHIAVPRARVANRDALTVLSAIDGRVMFVLPAGLFTIVGTTDTDYAGPIDEVRATRADVDYLLRSANAYFPGAQLTASDVIAAWAGIRPLVAGRGADPGSTSREHAITWTAPGLLSVTGGKLTTYRSMAASVVDQVVRALGATGHPAATHAVPLPGGDMSSLAEETTIATAAIGIAPLAEHLVRMYGTAWRAVWTIVGSNTALSAPVVPTLPYIVAELHYAVEQEMALTLGDLLIRRLHVAYETRDHGIAAAPAAARAVGPLLGWSESDYSTQLAEYRAEIARIFGIAE
ncbi:MAG TPA: glycerol-3-phosphate dehydrogenase [Gemmatimonadaceae bacterium]|nr:glycerol-3-phosphate dehydrogenase [Gemmatimonadaceae bacterium]